LGRKSEPTENGKGPNEKKQEKITRMTVSFQTIQGVHQRRKGVLKEAEKKAKYEENSHNSVTKREPEGGRSKE